MSQWLEEKYIAIVGQQLGHFHKQSRTTYGFRCPFCGDSKKHQNKTRGYFFLYKGHYFYKCHNCNISMSLRSFLRQRSPELYREYQLDVIRQERPVAVVSPSAPTETSMFGFGKSKTTMTLPSIASLPNDHVAVRYCRGRGLPESALSHLYFTDEWTTWIKEMKWSYALPEDHAPRLIIPWFNRQRELLGAQARRIDATGNAARYVTLKQESCDDKIYGWERLDLHKRIYVVEGPLDSWFLPNAVASMDADLLRLRDKYFLNHAAVYVWDNEPRNAAVTANLFRAIKDGVSVVVWPSTLKEKDLNEMSQAGYTVSDIVEKHTYRGLRAELEFRRWRRMTI
jgi:hypothetical protein